MLEHRPPKWDGERFAPVISQEEYRKRCKETTQQQVADLVSSAEYRELERTKLRDRFTYYTGIGTNWTTWAVLGLIAVATFVAWLSAMSSIATIIVRPRICHITVP